jgi:hypothetical protein
MRIKEVSFYDSNLQIKTSETQTPGQDEYMSCSSYMCLGVMALRTFEMRLLVQDEYISCSSYMYFDVMGGN